MIAWGGYVAGDPYSCTGGYYDPATDSWRNTSILNVPAGRHTHTTLWTGTKLFVYSTSFGGNAGGLYDPGVADATAPTVVGVFSDAPAGAYGAGSVINVIVGFSEMVSVNTAGGTPRITLETGTTDRLAHYAGGSTTNSLLFKYTVQTGDISNDLDYTATASLALNSGTIKDMAGNDATLTLASPAAAGSLGAANAIEIGMGTWSNLSTTGAPIPRRKGVIVWTGSKLINWAGENGTYYNTGGIYDPVANSWTLMSSTNAPAPRLLRYSQSENMQPAV
jgi:hypothetical protein